MRSGSEVALGSSANGALASVEGNTHAAGIRLQNGYVEWSGLRIPIMAARQDPGRGAPCEDDALSARATPRSWSRSLASSFRRGRPQRSTNRS